MTKLEELMAIIEGGQVQSICHCLQQLLDAGYTQEQIVSQGVMPALQNVGRRFETQEIFIPQMLLAARTVNMGNEFLRTKMEFQPPKTRHKVVLGTVKDDLHYIGKNLVAVSMRAVGIEVVDLGVDVSAEQFVSAVENDPDVAIVGISSLLTTTLPAMRKTVKALKSSAAAGRISIMVGGGPVTREMAESMGADVFTETAYEAAAAARRLLDHMEGQS